MEMISVPNDIFTLVSLNQIDADALAEYVVAKKKLVYRKDAPGEKVEDTEKVGGVPSSLVAVAINQQHRDTVNNALHFDGKTTDYFMSQDDGQKVTNLVDILRKIYDTQVHSLRDEVYQLKNKLAKSGFVQNDGQYFGFHDLFQNGLPRHENKKLTNATTLGVEEKDRLLIKDPEVFKKLHPLDYIAIKNVEMNAFRVRQIKEKEGDGETIILDRNLDSVFYAKDYEIYKSAGCVLDGAFKFAMPPINSIGSENYYSGVSDDSYNVYKKLDERKKGYAYNFKIPEGKSGYLVDVELCLRAYGNPGAIVCYIIDERDLKKFKNPAQAEREYIRSRKEKNSDWHFFAKSTPMNTLRADEGKRYVRFNFVDSITKSLPLLPEPDLNEKISYVLIVELQEGDNDNYYKLLFLQHRNPDGTLVDLQLNNTTYYYNRLKNDSLEQTAKTDNEINNFDLYYQVHTLENNKINVTPNSEGLYSSVMYTRKNNNANKIRVALRVRREGVFTISTEESPIGITTQEISLKHVHKYGAIKRIDDLCLTGQITTPIELKKGAADISYPTPVVIGDSVTTLKGFTEDAITINKPIMVFDKDKIYRMGYIVSVKAYKLNFNKEDGVISYSDPVRFNLPLTEIYRDIESTDDSSDRLIFETPLTDHFNYFEIQVYWENHKLSSYTDIRQEQLAEIKEITVSTNDFI